MGRPRLLVLHDLAEPTFITRQLIATLESISHGFEIVTCIRRDGSLRQSLALFGETCSLNEAHSMRADAVYFSSFEIALATRGGRRFEMPAVINLIHEGQALRSPGVEWLRDLADVFISPTLACAQYATNTCGIPPGKMALVPLFPPHAVPRTKAKQKATRAIGADIELDWQAGSVLWLYTVKHVHREAPDRFRFVERLRPADDLTAFRYRLAKQRLGLDSVIQPAGCADIESFVDELDLLIDPSWSSLVSPSTFVAQSLGVRAAAFGTNEAALEHLGGGAVTAPRPDPATMAREILAANLDAVARERQASGTDPTRRWVELLESVIARA